MLRSLHVEGGKSRDAREQRGQRPRKMELHLKHIARLAATLGLAAFFGVIPMVAHAGTTGTISGVVTQPDGAPLAGVTVTATSPSQKATTSTDSHGFYSLLALIPDTYTVSFSRSEYGPVSVPQVVVQQDQNLSLNEKLSLVLRTIAHIQSTAAGSLVRPREGSDVYNVSGQELTAATNPGDLHETLYQWTAIVPGVTSTGFPSQPRVRGGQVTDLGYEFEGIPIQDNIVGFFTTNLSNVGVQNLEVYTGGLGAADSANGSGYLNSVLRTGTNPGFTELASDITGPGFNHLLTFQSGYATPDHRWSYYVGFDGVNSQNNYDNGKYTFPGVLFFGGDGPGPVITRDLVGNFHYRPDPNDDFQFVITNSYGQFNFDYLLDRSSGAPPALAFAPCAGAVPNGVTHTHASGGFAPNGQPCPAGIYWTALANDKGNIWYHWGGLGKIQWTHNLNDHSFFSLRLAENYNEYIFDQPLADANIPTLENPGDLWSWAGTHCPTYPYAAGSPVAIPTGLPHSLCAFDNGIQTFWGDRRSQIYYGGLDYQNLISDNITVKAGISNQLNENLFNYYLTDRFTHVFNEFFFPGIYENSTYPTSQPHMYAEGDFHYGKWLLEPGVLWAQEHYGFPGGGQTVSIVDPTFNGTYEFNANNVLRFSYGNTSSFVGSAYVYTRPDGLIVRNPLAAGTSFNPQLNHWADLMWEHQFNATTSMKVGPWIGKTTNYFELYRPVVGYVSGVPIFAKLPVLADNQQHHDFGVEFELQHIDNHPVGLSFWLTATYDNYWTTSALAASFESFPEPQDLINAGHLIRATANPLWNTAYAFDFHDNDFHFDPLVIYQTDFFYNTSNIKPACSTCAPPHPSYFTTPENIASAYWIVNLDVWQDIGPRKNFFIGVKADNLFNNMHDVVPCETFSGTGCGPFYGPWSGVNVPPKTFIYQNYSQNPRLFEFYAGVKIGAAPPGY